MESIQGDKIGQDVEKRFARFLFLRNALDIS